MASTAGWPFPRSWTTSRRQKLLGAAHNIDIATRFAIRTTAINTPVLLESIARIARLLQVGGSRETVQSHRPSRRSIVSASNVHETIRKILNVARWKNRDNVARDRDRGAGLPSKIDYSLQVGPATIFPVSGGDLSLTNIIGGISRRARASVFPNRIVINRTFPRCWRAQSTSFETARRSKRRDAPRLLQDEQRR